MRQEDDDIKDINPELNAGPADNFRRSVQRFTFKAPESTSSQYRRSARLGIKAEINGSAPELTVSAFPSPKKRALQTDDKSPRKEKRKRGYAAPEVYAHLDYLTDCLAENLEVMFCGINPGVLSAEVGHHFAHPTNHFYKMLYGSGLTDRLVPASEDHTLPSLYSLGITDLVDRPTSGADEISDREMVDSMPTLLQKVVTYKPRVVCFIGKGMWLNVEKGFKRAIASARSPELNPSQGISSKRHPRTGNQVGTSNTQKPTKGSPSAVLDSGFGLRPYKVVHPGEVGSPIRETLFFCSPSSSGLATNMTLLGKTNLLKVLRENVLGHKNGTLDCSSMQQVPV
ncbi:hypothetical protein M0805_000141 [Coniferiporia weirii]|nr:hypothetical protein M0805_000141 [Coniferiporia weirii]